MRYTDADARIDHEAAKDHGPLTYDELLAMGLSRHGVTSRVQSGRLIAIHPGIYVPRAYPTTNLTRIAAAVKWGGDGALASHRSAGADLYELDGVPRGHVEVWVNGGGRRSGITARRMSANDRPARRYVKGIACTGVERTLRDLCAVLPPHRVGLAMDDALRRKMTILDRLHAEAQRACRRGVAGCRVFKQLIALRDERDEKVRSVAETRMLRVMKRVKVEEVQADFRVEDGNRNYYLDFAFPRRRIGVELHSIEWHFGEDKWKADLARDRRLTLLGWTTMYFSRDDPMFRPQVVYDEVTQLLLMRAPISG